MTPLSSASSSVRNSFTLAGTPALRTVKKKSNSMGTRLRSPASLLQEDELLEEMHVLLVLEERPVERRDRGLVARPGQRLRRGVLGEGQLHATEELPGRGLLL